MQELRYAIRSLRRTPGFTLAVVLTLGLGMGASTAVYTLLKRVVLDPLPYPHAEQLIRLKSPVPGVAPGEEWNLSAGEFFYLRDRATSLADIGGYQRWVGNVQGAGDPQRASVAVVTASMLRLLGARAETGRLFGDADDLPGSAPIVVLSHAFWQRQFAGDPGVIGRPLRINDVMRQVVGVMAPGIELPHERGAPAIPAADLWWPMQLNPAGPFQNSHVIPMIARLAPGVFHQRAQEELTRLTAGLPEVLPGPYSPAFMARSRFTTALYPLKQYVLGDAARNLWILLGAVAIVLMVAYGNVANLLLVRIEGRRREMAIRAALGAGRAATARQFFVEGLVLSAAGGVVALVVATWGVNSLASLAPPGIPRIAELRVDATVLAFASALSLVIALALSCLASAHQGATQFSQALIEGGRSATVGAGRQRTRGALLVSQVALAVVLVIGAGLLMRSYRALRAVHSGIDAEGVLTLQLSLPRQYDSLAAMWQFYDQLTSRIQGIPGVVASGVSWSLPLTGTYGCTVQSFEDPAVQAHLREIGSTTCADMAPASPGYFEALGIPVVAGRGLNAADNDQPERGSVVVSQAFAERFWPGQDPIGKGVRPFGNGGPPWYRVVGVVGDVRATSLDEPVATAIYYPVVAIPQTPRWWPGNMFLVVRTTRDNPSALLPDIRAIVRGADPAIPLANAEEMESILARSMSHLSFTMMLLGIAAAAALLLAAIGLYGVVSYLVARRTGEIGVRVALGALPGEVQRMVVGRSLRLTLVGAAAGVVVAAGATRALGGLLFGVRQFDMVSYGVAVVVLSVVALVAAWVPARRAAAVDPATALRSE